MPLFAATPSFSACCHSTAAFAESTMLPSTCHVLFSFTRIAPRRRATPRHAYASRQIRRQHARSAIWRHKPAARLLFASHVICATNDRQRVGAAGDALSPSSLMRHPAMMRQAGGRKCTPCAATPAQKPARPLSSSAARQAPMEVRLARCEIGKEVWGVGCAARAAQMRALREKAFCLRSSLRACRQLAFCSR